MRGRNEKKWVRQQHWDFVDQERKKWKGGYKGEQSKTREKTSNKGKRLSQILGRGENGKKPPERKHWGAK